MIDVIIATPGHSMCAEYVQSLMRTTQLLHKHNISYIFTNAYSSLVHHARELTASGGGPGEMRLDPTHRGPLGNARYKKIFWIDSDISWIPEDFMRLYESDKDVVTGVYLIADGSMSSCMTGQYPSGIPTDLVRESRGLHEVNGAGFGFIAIKYGVFESIPRPWFICMPQEVAPGVIDTVSEDISWCIKVRQAGFKIFMDAEVRVGHIKSRRLGF
jgi:hypothetical protein